MNNTYKISGSLSNLFHHFPEEERTEERYSQLLNTPITFDSPFGDKRIGVVTEVDIENDSFIGYLFDCAISLEVSCDGMMPRGIFIQ